MGATLQIRLDGGRIVQPSRALGLHTFHIRPDECTGLAQIAQLLEQNYHNPGELEAKCVGLLASLGNPNLNGFAAYNNSQAIKHSPVEQKRRTAIIKTQVHLKWLLHHAEYGAAFRILLGRVLQQFGLAPTDFARCRHVHFLAQDRAAHALFKWHVDNKENKGLTLNSVTAVVQLSSTCSAMRIFGFADEHRFIGPGAGCGFLSAAIHKSCQVPLVAGDMPVTLKAVFFLE